MDVTDWDDEHEGDCECAVCDTLIMRPDPDWRPVWLAPGERQCRCVFCHTVGDQAYWTALGMPVGVCCGRRIEEKL